MSTESALQMSVDDYAAANSLVPPLSIEELREHAEKIDPAQLDLTMVLLNNAVWHETVASIPYQRRLLLLPQCLRAFGECPAELDEYGLLCESCGRCPIGELQTMAEDLGYVVLVAEGSTVVSKLITGGKIDAVVGVSCLSALEKSFPHMADGAIPGLAIPLSADGCVNTQVDLDAVRSAIALKSSKPWKNTLNTDQLRTIVDAWFAEPLTVETQTEQLAMDWLLKEGKRWRPFLLACSYSALNSGTTDLPDEVRRLALAVECFHKASLIHDDIEDADDLRYGQPSLHCQVGIPVAINIGDFLIGEGYRWISTVETRTSELFRIAAENHRTLCLGQGEELYSLFTGATLTASSAIEIARRKTAPAFGAALQLGAAAAGADRDLLATLQAFSESLGIAYQIRDDLEEYKTGEAADLRASIILALGNDASSEATPPLEDLMVVEKAEQLLAHYKKEAIRALNPLQNALLKSLLRRITTKMLGGA